MSTSAKQSAIDKLHRMYVATLTLELQAAQPSAAILSVIGNFLKNSGTKPTNDSPAMKRLAVSYEALPFQDELPALPTHPNQKDQH
jgi:hypothetical protein